MMKALIKIKNNPSVKMVKGMVRIIITGLTMVFKNASVAAKITAVKGPSICTPGNMADVTKIANVEITILKINFIFVTLSFQRYNEFVIQISSTMKKCLLMLFLIGSFITAKCDEGMWLPILLKSLNEADMQSKGCKLSAEEIFSINKTSLKDGIVLFGGGCTGEIISAEGLLLTNHHCGYGQIQQHSTVEKDYLTEGFWAKNKSEELPNPGLSATFIISMKDVTEEVLSQVSGNDSEAIREKKIQEKIKAIEIKAKEGTHYGALVKPFYNGNQFYLFITETFTDVRLVGAPPSSIGKFGSDTDNWMWPRHTGDFSLFRIYAGKDNLPAPYSKDNVPFKPRYHFTISLSDVQEGDFTMVYGFPGRTNEYLSSYAVKMIRDVVNPVKIKLRDKKLTLTDQYMRKNDTVRIKYAAKYYSVANAFKKWQGELKGIDRLEVIAKKENEEKEFLKKAIYTNNNEASTLLIDMELAYQKYTLFNKRRDFFNEAFKGSELMNFAISFNLQLNKIKSVGNDKQKQKAEIEQLKNMYLGFTKNYDQRVDRDVFSGLMQIYFDDMQQDLPSHLFANFKKKYRSNMQQWATQLYKESVFNNSKKTLSLLDKLPAKSSTFENDAAIKLAGVFYKYFLDEVQPEFLKLDTVIQVLNRKYMKHQLTLLTDKKFYPDANSTLRVAYGKVSGYAPYDAVQYQPYTTLKGAMEKENDAITEFNIHPKLKSLYLAKDYGRYGDKDGNMRIAFIASNHTTGGNSGSPVLNDKGELIGTNFDRNWEGTVSDIKYDAGMVRNIVVDIHYTLFIIDKFAGAKNLIDELTIKN